MEREPNLAFLTAAALSAAERVLLFCIASGTDWGNVGVPAKAVTMTMLKGLVERPSTGHLSLTKQGRDVLAALLKEPSAGK
jgi:hypothetical protein